jgi:hypothetical protein
LNVTSSGVKRGAERLQRLGYVRETFNARDVHRPAAEEYDEDKIVPKHNEIVMSLENSFSVLPKIVTRITVQATDAFLQPGNGGGADSQTYLNVVNLRRNRELLQ